MSYTKQTWETGDVVTAAKMNHIEDGIAALEATVPTGSWNDLTNRPFYDDFTATGVILPETSITCNSQYNNSSWYYSGPVGSFSSAPFTSGQFYRVTYDNTEYILEAWFDDGYVFIGNGDCYGLFNPASDTEVPFIIDGVSTGDNTWQLEFSSTNNTAKTYKIESMSGNRKLIPSRMLPDTSSVFSLYFNMNANTQNKTYGSSTYYGWQEENGKTYNDLIAAYHKGKFPYVIAIHNGSAISILYPTTWSESYGIFQLDLFTAEAVLSTHAYTIFADIGNSDYNLWMCDTNV